MKTRSPSGHGGGGGCNSPPALAHELTALELSPDDSKDDTSVRIGDKPASRHRATRGRCPLFIFLLLRSGGATASCTAAAASSWAAAAGPAQAAD